MYVVQQGCEAQWQQRPSCKGSVPTMFNKVYGLMCEKCFQQFLARMRLYYDIETQREVRHSFSRFIRKAA